MMTNSHDSKYRENSYAEICTSPECRKSAFTLLGFTIFPLIIGGISAILSRTAILDYALLKKPSFAPPSLIFPLVWTILYILMGIASYTIYISNSEERTYTMTLYGMQLVLNFFWSIVFFTLGLHFVAFVILMLMWLILAALTWTMRKVSKVGMSLLIPLFLWTTFAAILNLSVAIMN